MEIMVKILVKWSRNIQISVLNKFPMLSNSIKNFNDAKIIAEMISRLQIYDHDFDEYDSFPYPFPNLKSIECIVDEIGSGIIDSLTCRKIPKIVIGLDLYMDEAPKMAQINNCMIDHPNVKFDIMLNFTHSDWYDHSLTLKNEFIKSLQIHITPNENELLIQKLECFDRHELMHIHLHDSLTLFKDKQFPHLKNLNIHMIVCYTSELSYFPFSVKVLELNIGKSVDNGTWKVSQNLVMIRLKIRGYHNFSNRNASLIWENDLLNTSDLKTHQLLNWLFQ